MNLIVIGTDRKIFEEGSAVRERQIEYGRMFDQVHIVIFTTRIMKYESRIRLSENVWAYPTNSRNKLFYIWDAFKLGKALSSKLPASSSVISTQDSFETGLVGLWLKLRFGLPLQVQIHTDFMNKFFIKHSLLNLVRFLVAHLILPYADGVRVVSKKIKDSIYDLAKNLRVLPILVGTNIQNLNNEKPTIFSVITVGRLESEKAVAVGIRAFAQFIKEGVPAKYIIVGDGSEKANLQKLAKELGVAEKVDFVGWQNDLAPFYAKASVYLSTSLYEGYGMTLIEASLFGLPIVMTDTGLADDLFVDGKSALICKQNDVAGLSKALSSLSTNQILAKTIADTARAEVLKRQVSKETYLEKYKEALLAVSEAKVGRNIVLRFFGLIKNMIGHIRLLRFAIGGLSIALAQILLLYVLTEFAGLWYLISSAISFCFAVITSFLVQKYWAFRDNSKERALRQFLQFLAVALIGIVINTASMFFWVDLLGVWYVLAQIITGFIIMVVNFTIYKFVIFRHTK